MTRPIRILLQTTIPSIEDDWNISRFSMLHNYLSSLKDASGAPLFEVTSRDRHANAAGNDPVLSNLMDSEFDELWLFAVDVGDGMSEADCKGISDFRRRGGGMMVTRDHMDLGCSVCNLAGVGAAHYFHTKNLDPDPTRNRIDDPYTTYISYPNYHSGKNGDYQRITIVEPRHPLFQNPESPSGWIEFLPAHPHEGAVGVPAGAMHARVAATGVSQVTGRIFNIAIVLEEEVDAAGNHLGRAVAESTFHHFCDYNWDARAGCPSFVSEAPGDSMQTEARALKDVQAYVKNLALWLAPG